MTWSICFAVAVAALLLSVSGAVAAHRGRMPVMKALRPIHLLFAGSVVMCIALCYPAYHTVYEEEALQGMRSAVISVQQAIRVFGADSMYTDIFEQIHQAPVVLQRMYLLLVLVVQFFAPFLSLGFVLSFFKNVSAGLRYRFSYFQDVYVFSGLNKRTVLLAQDIARTHRGARIVFADAYDDEEGMDAERIEQARELRAICFRKGLHAVNWAAHSREKQLYFFVMGQNEVQNADHALRLLERYNDLENSHLYIFSTGVEGELLLAGRLRGKMKVRRVNTVRSLVLRTLHEEGHLLFKNALPVKGETYKQISALIVGMGGYGTEMMKALCWFGQMDGYRLKINAVDQDPLAGERFAALCPELMDEKYNGVFTAGEAGYDIRVLSGVDVETKTFTDHLSTLSDITYVFISLGSDEQNIKTAADLRMRFERMKLHPQIHCVLSSDKVKDVLKNVKNHAHQPYDICFVGDEKTAYSQAVILDSDVEEDAFRRHCQYCDGDPDREEDFWRYEYNYHSSMALAVHGALRKKLKIPGADKPAAQLTPQEKASLETLEHCRWNAYMRSEGFVYSGSDEKSSRNDLGRMHHNLVPFDRLSQEIKDIDSRVGAGIKE